jgi:replicative DNA helicase
VLANEDAERAVIGSVLLAWDKTLDMAVNKFRLTPEHFYFPPSRRLWEGITELAARGTPIDILTLGEYARNAGFLEQIGGPIALNRLVDATPTEAHAEYYMAIVRDNAVLREAVKTCRDAIADAHRSDNALEFISRLPSRFMDGYTACQDETPNADLMADSMRRWQDAAEKKKPAIGLYTPWSKLTYLMSGFETGLTILAGRPSAGKTTFEDQCCMALAFAGRAVARCTLDSTRQELLERAICRKAGVSLPKLKFGFGRRDQLANANSAAIDIGNAPIHINDRDRDIGGICAYARAMKRKHDIAMLTVDYIQLIEAEEMGTNEWNTVARVSYASRKLKALSFELGIPVLVLSQLSRAVEKEEREPQLSDLRDSGAIEQDAAKVIFLYVDSDKRKQMEAVEPGATKHKRPVVVNLMKHKNGGTGMIPFWLYPPYFNFTPAEIGTVAGKTEAFVDDDLPMDRKHDAEAWRQLPDYLPMDESEASHDDAE